MFRLWTHSYTLYILSVICTFLNGFLLFSDEFLALFMCYFYLFSLYFSLYFYRPLYTSYRYVSVFQHIYICVYMQLWNSRMLFITGFTHAKLVSLTSPCCSGWPAPNEYSSRPTTRAEQRWVRWLQCLIRKWSCVNHQFQLNTQIAYEPTYMAHYRYYLLLFNYWHWHKI